MSENQSVTQAATPLRRQPVQQRSARRVERMLDASAELLDEIGYEGLTTTLIAKRAGVAVGSLYQFFPDKRAVVQALTQRNLERFIAAVNERLGTLDPHHWWDVVDSLLDIYLTMHRQVPGFSTVHFGDVVDLQLLDDGCQLRQNLVCLLVVLELGGDEFSEVAERLGGVEDVLFG